MATEKRYKLTSKQFDHYINAQREAAELVAAAQAARSKLATVGELLLDFHQINPNSNTRVDEKTQEIVVTLEEVPAAPAPAPTVEVVPPPAPEVPAAA